MQLRLTRPPTRDSRTELTRPGETLSESAGKALADDRILKPSSPEPISPALMQLRNWYIGRSESAASKLATEHSRGFAIGSRDGESPPATVDYRPTRITVDVEKSRIIDIHRKN